MHTAIAAFLVSFLLVVGVSGWHLLRGHSNQLVKRAFSMSLWIALITSCAQVVIGDSHGLNTLKYQPAKIAAIEGYWETNKNKAMPLLLFAILDMKIDSMKLYNRLSEKNITISPSTLFQKDNMFCNHMRLNCFFHFTHIIKKALLVMVDTIKTINCS